MSWTWIGSDFRQSQRAKALVHRAVASKIWKCRLACRAVASRIWKRRLARWAGLEPATDGLENRCSIRLSYHRVISRQ